jgi:hypothetical protein
MKRTLSSAFLLGVMICCFVFDQPEMSRSTARLIIGIVILGPVYVGLIYLVTMGRGEQ